MASSSGGTGQVISLPKGGGALHGIGETFSPDLHTDTGNFSVPIALPAGRNGFQPDLSLVYSTGNGNGPGVSRKTSKGVPRYDDARDTFILSGAEDLVPVEVQGAKTLDQPRTEGLGAPGPAVHRNQARPRRARGRSTGRSSRSIPSAHLLPPPAGERVTQWERGDDPLTQFTFTVDYDGFGQPQQQTRSPVHAAGVSWTTVRQRDISRPGAGGPMRSLSIPQTTSGTGWRRSLRSRSRTASASVCKALPN